MLIGSLILSQKIVIDFCESQLKRVLIFETEVFRST